jgi:hypothetical protein
MAFKYLKYTYVTFGCKCRVFVFCLCISVFSFNDVILVCCNTVLSVRVSNAESYMYTHTRI